MKLSPNLSTTYQDGKNKWTHLISQKAEDVAQWSHTGNTTCQLLA